MTPITLNATARKLVASALLLSGLALTGCVSVQMPEPTPSAANVEKLRSAQLAPANVGNFVLAAGKPVDMDTSLSGLRGSSVKPGTGSFAKQLREELITELKAASLLDPAAKTLIEGQLTDSMVDAAMGTGKGRLAARFSVKRDGRVVFDKELAVDASWESSFMGAVAIPAAINQYGALYKSLVGKLIDDPDFRKALKAN